jgi:hypothetical protein
MWQRRFLFLFLLFAPNLFMANLCAEQKPDDFRWMNFHSPKDQDIVVWVTRSLTVENWTAIREIGVKYDAALVVTTARATPQSQPGTDTFTVWSVSLTTHTAPAPLMKGVNLRWFDWMRFADDKPLELAALYDNCRDCAADTYFTAFYYDVAHHAWAARWMRGGQGVPVWNTNPSTGVTWTQVYAVLAGENGVAQLATWNHFDYGKQKDPGDFVYRYDLDSFSGLERTLPLSGKDSDAMKLRLCRGQDAVSGLARGQDAELCQQMLKPFQQRKLVTTPPANNRGKSAPPGARR